MGASVRIEDDAFSDRRYHRLASALDLVSCAAARGIDPADLGRGVMATLWRQCTLESTYVLPPDDVNRVLGEKGVEALIYARLGELQDDGLVRIKGTLGRVEWLEKKRADGRKHGKKGAQFGKLGGRPRKPPEETPSKPGKGVKKNPPPAPAPAPAPAQEDLAEQTNQLGLAEVAPPPKHSANGVDSKAFRAAYESLFAEANDGARPTWNAAKNAQAAQLVKTLGSDVAIRRAENMFRHPPPWPPPPHDLGTLVQHTDRFATPYRNGKGTAAHQADDVGRFKTLTRPSGGSNGDA